MVAEVVGGVMQENQRPPSSVLAMVHKTLMHQQGAVGILTQLVLEEGGKVVLLLLEVHPDFRLRQMKITTWILHGVAEETATTLVATDVGHQDQATVGLVSSNNKQ